MRQFNWKAQEARETIPDKVSVTGHMPKGKTYDLSCHNGLSSKEAWKAQKEARLIAESSLKMRFEAKLREFTL